MISYKFAFVFAVVISCVSTLKAVTKNGKIWRQVGSVEGKTFYADNDAKLDWETAQYYCDMYYMELASITSAAQANLIDNAYDESDFSGYYWTSGRDALSLRQFSWNDTNSQPSTDILLYYGTESDGDFRMIRNCLFLDSDKVAGLYVHPNDCNKKVRVLCQQIN